MTPSQQAQFNRMRAALRTIANDYLTVHGCHWEAKRQGLEPEEFLAMAYENIQALAKGAVKGVRPVGEVKP